MIKNKELHKKNLNFAQMYRNGSNFLQNKLDFNENLKKVLKNTGILPLNCKIPKIH